MAIRFTRNELAFPKNGRSISSQQQVERVNGQRFTGQLPWDGQIHRLASLCSLAMMFSIFLYLPCRTEYRPSASSPLALGMPLQAIWHGVLLVVRQKLTFAFHRFPYQSVVSLSWHVATLAWHTRPHSFFRTPIRGRSRPCLSDPSRLYI